jgi:hypothetical protein
MSNAACKELERNPIMTGFLQSAAKAFAWGKRFTMILPMPLPDCDLFWSQSA